MAEYRELFRNNNETVQELKNCAQTIIDNAESIIGTEKLQGRFIISINMIPGEVPYINVNRDIYSPKVMYKED